MRDQLETQYENELAFIRKLGAEFARERPKIADRLLLNRESGFSEDPHVERMIEAFAFLTARIRLKLEDEFPELTDAMLNVLYPHYLAPIPSMAIVQFVVDPAQGKLTTGHTIPRHTELYSREARGVRCRFRTAYPTTLWPIEVAEAQYLSAPFGRDIILPPKSRRSEAAIRLKLRATGGDAFSKLKLDRLRFFLSGDDPTVHTLYELIFNHVSDLMIRGGTAPNDPDPVVLSPDCLQPVGYGRDEGMLPYQHRSFIGYRLLTEYFAFPSKFLFVDLTGLEALRRQDFREELEVFLFLDRTAPALQPDVEATTFRLGCCPVVNLFSQNADPIRITHAKTEYHVLPDVRHPSALEVYSVDEVESTNPMTKENVTFLPFFSFRHATDPGSKRAFWCMHRRSSLRRDDTGTEVYLSLVDLNFQPTVPPVEVLTLRTTCTNRNLPSELKAAGGIDWQFQLQGQAPLRRISPIVGPTPPSRMPPGQSRWRLISHLCLNHLSITGGEDGADVLREILKLYDYAQSRVSRQHIEGITSITSRRSIAPIADGTASGFCRGVELTVEFDEEKYVGSGVFLLACVLERFFALYTSINSFTRTVATTKQREGFLKRWPARTGEQTLL